MHHTPCHTRCITHTGCITPFSTHTFFPFSLTQGVQVGWAVVAVDGRPLSGAGDLAAAISDRRAHAKDVSFRRIFEMSLTFVPSGGALLLRTRVRRSKRAREKVREREEKERDNVCENRGSVEEKEDIGKKPQV